MPQKPRYLSFYLGKGRESLRLPTLHKKLSKSALSALPPSTQIILIQTLCGQRMPKLTKLTKCSSLCRNFHTFPVTEGYAICNSISSSQPQQESSPTEQNSSNPERHEFRKRHVSLLPEAREMPKILPRKTRILATPKFFATLSQSITKTNRKRHEFCTKLHSLTPAKMPRKVFSFPEFRTSL